MLKLHHSTVWHYNNYYTQRLMTAATTVIGQIQIEYKNSLLLNQLGIQINTSFEKNCNFNKRKAIFVHGYPANSIALKTWSKC